MRYKFTYYLLLFWNLNLTGHPAFLLTSLTGALGSWWKSRMTRKSRKHLHKRCHLPTRTGASLIAQLARNLPAMQETLTWLLGQENLLEKGHPFPLFPIVWVSNISQKTLWDIFVGQKGSEKIKKKTTSSLKLVELDFDRTPRISWNVRA